MLAGDATTAVAAEQAATRLADLADRRLQLDRLQVHAPMDDQVVNLAESVVICGLGTLVGLALPALAAQLTDWLNLNVPLLVGWRAVALALGASATIGLIFGNQPASRAARLSPVVALARD